MTSNVRKRLVLGTASFVMAAGLCAQLHMGNTGSHKSIKQRDRYVVDLCSARRVHGEVEINSSDIGSIVKEYPEMKLGIEMDRHGQKWLGLQVNPSESMQMPHEITIGVHGYEYKVSSGSFEIPLLRILEEKNGEVSTSHKNRPAIFSRSAIFLDASQLGRSDNVLVNGTNTRTPRFVPTRHEIVAGKGAETLLQNNSLLAEIYVLFRKGRLEATVKPAKRRFRDDISSLEQLQKEDNIKMYFKHVKYGIDVIFFLYGMLITSESYMAVKRRHNEKTKTQKS